MKKKYVIIEKDRGVFLGAYSGYAFFAKNDPIGIPKAFTFDSERVAKLYVETNLPSFANTTFYAQVTTNSSYASVVDIIKAGYAEHTYNMIDFLPMQSEAIH